MRYSSTPPQFEGQGDRPPTLQTRISDWIEAGPNGFRGVLRALTLLVVIFGLVGGITKWPLLGLWLGGFVLVGFGLVQALKWNLKWAVGLTVSGLVVGALSLAALPSRSTPGTSRPVAASPSQMAQTVPAPTATPTPTRTPSPTPTTTRTTTPIPTATRTAPKPTAAATTTMRPSVDTSDTSSSVTVSQKNAIRSANKYLDYTAFSKKGLIKQLEYEKYSTADATYAVEHISVDWNHQADRSAEKYLEYTSFSREGLIRQLEYEGFTQSQATHGVNSVGL